MCFLMFGGSEVLLDWDGVLPPPHFSANCIPAFLTTAITRPGSWGGGLDVNLYGHADCKIYILFTSVIFAQCYLNIKETLLATFHLPKYPERLHFDICVLLLCHPVHQRSIRCFVISTLSSSSPSTSSSSSTLSSEPTFSSNSL